MNNIFLTFNNHANVEDEFYISQQKTDIVERDKSDAHNYMARDYGSKKKKFTIGSQVPTKMLL